VPYYLFAGAIAVVLVPLKLLGELGAASAIYRGVSATPSPR
jgi:hypothetical protein